MRKRLSPTRVIALLSGMAMVYSFVRVFVMFSESLALVYDERQQDQELIELCQNGQARGSPKMREACLRARADQASPVVFKAFTHAVQTAFKDFSDTVGSPFKVLVLVLFLASGVFMPLLPWARLLLSQPVAEYNHNSTEGMTFISLVPSENEVRRPSVRNRLRNATKRLRLLPRVREDTDGSSELYAVENGAHDPCAQNGGIGFVHTAWSTGHGDGHSHLHED